MLSCCCGSCLTCAEVWKEMRKSFTEDEDQSSMDIRMDVMLLKEQYNSIRDKQRRETQVVCFKKGKNIFCALNGGIFLNKPLEFITIIVFHA